jgi:ABC-2 type transport system permease protein
MRAYWHYLVKSFKKNAAYRSAAWIHVAASMVSISIQASIWTALIGSGSADGITRDQMVTYAILNSAMYAALFTGLYSDVDARLRSGDIGIDLLRPVRYPLVLLADQLGRAAYRLIFMVIPTVALAALAFGFSPPASVTSALGYVLVLPLTIVISYAIGYLIALLAFWYLTTFHFSWAIGALVTVFSGSVLPLWFFPGRWELVARALPFQFLGFVPAATWMGELAGADLVLTWLLGAAWAVTMLGLTTWLWTRAITRLVVQGG